MTNSKRNYIWNTAGVFAQNALFPVLLLIVTRVNGLTESGYFSFAFSIAMIFYAVALWGGRTYQTSDTKKSFNQNEYVNSRVFLAILVIFIAAVFSIVSGYSTGELELLLILVSIKALDAVSDSVYGVMQVNQKLYVSGKSLVYKTIAGLAVFCLINLTTNSVTISSLGILIVNLIIFFIYDLRRVNKIDAIDLTAGSIIKDLSTVIQIAKKTVWVFLISILLLLTINIPRFFMYTYNPSELGYFGIILMSVSTLSLLSTLLIQPRIVRLSRIYHFQNKDIFRLQVKKLATVNIWLGAFALIIVFMYGVQLFSLLFGVSFDGYQLSLVVATIGGIAYATSIIYATVLTIMRSFKIQVIVLLVTNLILITISWLLSYSYSLLGAIFLFSFVSVVQLASFYTAYRNVLSKEASNEKNEHSNDRL